ncbi:MAG TPA: tRNA (adenosine(37)-N6)-threonylcarbamoyltransferase complex ATPase subunit type 1 TsaE [Xanthobacteraceae bacterium]|nr:tRNA (adenosine(37)-N6)-threonylcarbamoyltransferase complex ATPase subunit type 1 TsaE [Xanthobacteraceae bacterium]
MTFAAAGQPLDLPDEEATRRLASDVAAVLQDGDVVTLSGDLGAGKTTFARAVIRTLAADPTLDVPSPTFTLLQTYALARQTVVHADFYRIGAPEELDELGLEEAMAGAVTLIEWPEVAAALLPADRLDVGLSIPVSGNPAARQVRLTAFGTFGVRLERLLVRRHFLEESGFGGARRDPLAGDASTRRYERLWLSDRSLVLMDAPRRPDGPPLRHGLAYSAIAHLAEDVKPFVAMARGLRERGFSAPEIVAADLSEGLLVVEDLGDEGIATPAGEAIEERYTAAVDVLLALHAQALPAALRVAPRVEHWLPAYDSDALLIELELLLEWYLPLCGASPGSGPSSQFHTLWGDALQAVSEAPHTWVLRDFHSPNLMWLAARSGIARVGLLDFQDALMGPAAYDLVSLLQDARADIPERMEMALLSRYVLGRKAATPDFRAAPFLALYAALGAQRATKILGIFARLDRRDGKPQYLRHLPRLWGYLSRSLAHPTLAPLRAWYARNVPAPAA